MKKPFYKILYVQVICAIVIGILLGFFYPELGEKMKPLGDGFIKLIKMMIAPVIFCTVVTGVAGMENRKKSVKSVGSALLYFEAVTTIALVIGLVMVNLRNREQECMLIRQHWTWVLFPCMPQPDKKLNPRWISSSISFRQPLSEPLRKGRFFRFSSSP